ncbi:MAG TPA: hypothetical protein VEQ60_01070 [Longimicrobium sp.]|nr:hypothetical protein [Longimicrobium sp.]
MQAIRKALSNERLDAYGLGRTDDQKIANYLWNLALCESLYPALNGLEVVFRNAVFDAGARIFSGISTRDVPCWLDANPSLFDSDHEQFVVAAKQRLRDRGGALEPGRLVAELTFGFWTSLFEVRYERNRVLWPHLFGAQLLDSSAPRSMRSRKQLSPLLNRMRYLRNRIFHHEPIWHWGDLVQHHTMAMDLIGWFSPDLRATIEPGDRFLQVHAAGSTPYLQRVHSLIMAA